MPLIDNECYLLDNYEFDELHQFYDTDEKTIKIGIVTENPSQSVYLSVKKLFASHIGIFGNTGSGKSNTLARLYSELFATFSESEDFKKNSEFLIIDFNGEYADESTITDKKEIYTLQTKKDSDKKYPVSKDCFNIDIISILLEATEKLKGHF